MNVHMYTPRDAVSYTDRHCIITQSHPELCVCVFGGGGAGVKAQLIHIHSCASVTDSGCVRTNKENGSWAILYSTRTYYTCLYRLLIQLWTSLYIFWLNMRFFALTFVNIKSFCLYSSSLFSCIKGVLLRVLHGLRTFFSLLQIFGICKKIKDLQIVFRQYCWCSDQCCVNVQIHLPLCVL